MLRLACLLTLTCAARVTLAQPEPTEGSPEPTPASPTEPTPPIASEPTPAPPIAVQTQPPPPPEPELTEDQRAALANYEPSSVSLGGVLQAQLVKRQDSAVADDEDGFQLARARLDADAATRAGNLDLSARIEGDLSPAFRLLDAYANISRSWKDAHSQVALQAGQMRVPISRQQLLPETMLAFVDKAQLVSLVPERDLGVQLALSFAGLLRLTGGVFNGEGPNQVDNTNQRYLWAGRVELSPLSNATLAESAFGARFATIGVSFGRNRISLAERRDEIRYLGVDLALAYKGFSGAFEYLRAKTSSNAVEDFQGNGFVLQGNYLLPVRLPPYRQSRVELGVRLEEIDRNDTLPIAMPGEPTQSVRAVTAVATLYVRNHALKAQLAFTRFTELEDLTAFGGGATYDNDQLVLQLTYRLD